MTPFLRRTLAVCVLGLAACSPASQNVTMTTRTVRLDDNLPAMRAFVARPIATQSRPNEDIANDFLDLTFRMETGRALARLTRFDGPISVRVNGAAPPTLGSDLNGLLRRLRNEAGIDIYRTTGPTASVTIEAIPRAVLSAAVPRAACFVVPRVTSWAQFIQMGTRARTDWTTLQRRDQVAIFLPNDAAPQEIRDCLHEELAQAIGPLNDLYRLPDSVFNDDNIHAVLTGFDMLVLRMYYDPALQNGMSRREVAARLPALLTRLNPRGNLRRASGALRPQTSTTRDWIANMELALTSDTSGEHRRTAALNALSTAAARNWTGPRTGFAYYALGRLNLGHDSARAQSSFRQALRIYLSSPETRLHAAHVSVQLAAFALTEGEAQQVLDLVNPAITTARTYENAALLATLMMMKAEALTIQGRDSEARALHLDSLGWARYGFGSEQNVRARLREIASLNPT